jgi:GT2 family glycosyltransferase
MGAWSRQRRHRVSVGRRSVADTLIAYLHPNEIPATFHQSLTALLGYDSNRGRHIGPFANVRCATGGIPEGRNQVAAQLLSEPDHIEWLFMIDADMGFAPDVLERLHRAADKDTRPIVGGLCFAQREIARDGYHGFRCEARPTIYDWIEHPDGHMRFTGRAHYPVNSILECAATGAACLLIHRSVIEAIIEDKGPFWFDRLRGTDGSLLGEDISFFVRAAALEFPCHVDTSIKVTHFKSLWLGEPDFWSQFVPPPATERVTVVVPVLSRPQNVAPLVESLRASTGLADVLFVTEPDDLFEWAAIDEAGANRITHPGTFAQKVNTAVDHVTTPWVFLAGDDVVFRPGWLDHAMNVANKYGAQVVGTNDLGNPAVIAGDHATHMLISMDYIHETGASWDGPGLVCHEGYRHWYVDNEIVSAAKQRGVWGAAPGSIVEHNHPAWGKADDDEVYELGQSFSDRDAALFRKRVMAHAA